MEGILNLLKPPGMTSHDAVAYLRRLTGVRRIGHTGTLDPGAAGVLILCLGRTTRLARFLEPADKRYRAEITFGLSTRTQDAFGEPVAEADAGRLTGEALEQVLTGFVGSLEQVPPMTSAIKQGGRKLYELAREGRDVERAPRRVTIYSLSLIRVSRLGTPRPRAVFDVHCSKGTYIRTLCADIGAALQLPAYMSFLIRTAVGGFKLATTLTLEQVAQDVRAGSLPRRLLPPDKALAAFPVVLVRESAVRAVKNGARLFRPGAVNWPEGAVRFVRLHDAHGLLGVAEWREGHDKDKVWLQPVWITAEGREGDTRLK
ncbi:MAG: tRNA pseudouridine(55) synthase TruB [Thermoanaerobacterales bacterium]|nr:tRNA pseudouridine(55) synthase TruB [Thermoanaerobacterales bacterium]